MNASEAKDKESLFYFGNTKVIRLTNLRLTMPSFYPLPPPPSLPLPLPPFPFLPSSPSVPSLTPLKATRKGKKSVEGFEVTPGNRTRDLPHKTPRTHTNQLQQLTALQQLSFYFKILVTKQIKTQPVSSKAIRGGLCKK